MAGQSDRQGSRCSARASCGATSASTAAPSRSRTSTSTSAARATARRAPAACRSHGSINDEQHLDRIDGRVSFGDGLSLRNLDIWLDGSDISYGQPGWEIKISPQVELAGNGNQLTLRGNVDVVEGRYAQNFDLAGMIFTPKRTNEVVRAVLAGRAAARDDAPRPARAVARRSLRQEQHRRSVGRGERSTSRARCRSRASTAASRSRRAAASRRPASATRSRPIRARCASKRRRRSPKRRRRSICRASTTYIDNYEQQHELRLTLTGTALSPRLDR